MVKKVACFVLALSMTSSVHAGFLSGLATFAYALWRGGDILIEKSEYVNALQRLGSQEDGMLSWDMFDFLEAGKDYKKMRACIEGVGPAILLAYQVRRKGNMADAAVGLSLAGQIADIAHQYFTHDSLKMNDEMQEKYDAYLAAMSDAEKKELKKTFDGMRGLSHKAIQMRVYQFLALILAAFGGGFTTFTKEKREYSFASLSFAAAAILSMIHKYFAIKLRHDMHTHVTTILGKASAGEAISPAEELDSAESEA